MRPLTAALLHSCAACFARALSAAAIALLLATASVAQSATDGSTPSGLAPGSPAGSYALSDFDTVNLYNGSLNIRLSLLEIGGRGGAGYPITLHVEKKWTVHKELEPGVGTFYYADAGWWSEEGSGWRIFSAGKVDIRTAWREQPTGYPVESLTRITFTAPDGTEYELRDQLTNGQPASTQGGGGFNRGRVFVTADGTSATFYSDWDINDDPNFGQGFYDDQPDGYMLLKDGTRFRVTDGKIIWMRDRNGNKVSFSYDPSRRVTSIIDSLGRQVTITYPASGVTYTQVSFAGFGGAARTIKIGQTSLWSAGTLRSDFSSQSIGALFPELNGGGPANSTVINYVELPDGRRYQFQYNSYAEVARVVLPTGGAVEYDHAAGLTGAAASGFFSIGNGKYIYRRVVERRVYPNGGTGSSYESKMTYSRPETTTTNLGYVVADQLDPSGALKTRARHYYYGSPRASFAQQATQYASWQEDKEYKTEFYSTNGTTLLRKVENTWQQPLAGATWPLSQAETNTSVKPNSPQVTQVLTTLSDTGQVAKQTFAYDRYANRTDVYEYDYGAATHLRRTHTDYVTTNASGGTTYDYACDPSTTCGNASINKDVVHLRGLPARVSVYDAAGIEQARTTYEYDNYATDANHAALVDRFSITGLCTTYDAAGACSNTNPPSYATRGNATGTTKYIIASGAVTGSVYSFKQYDVAGNAVKTVDALGKISTVGYADSFCNGPTCGGTYNLNTYAFATSTASPVPDPAGLYGSAAALTASTVYDFWTGLVYSTTDANNKTTTLSYADALGNVDALDRLKSVTRPDGGKTDFNYGDTVGNLHVQTLSDLDASRRTEARQYFDGLGRSVRAFTWENQDTSKPWLTVDTQYDVMGRAWSVSAPYRSSGPGSTVNPSGRWTQTTFDALGRATQMKTTADGAYVTTSYSGNTATVTDQHDAGSQGHSRKSVTDALGRLTEIYEDPSGLNYVTSYQYDVLGYLRTVTQDTQTRTFVYDSLGRLTSSTNPESGAFNYTYDNNGNVLTRTDARGVTVTYAYDALNRNTTTDYSDTAAVNPDIKRFYDGAVNGKGRYNGFYKGGDYTTGANVEHTSTDSFDAVGRPLVRRQLFKTNGAWSQTYQVQRTYDKAGNVLTETYPSGHAVSYNYDAAGRPGDNGTAKAFGGNLGDGVARTYDSEVRYHEMGGTEQERFGTDTPVYDKGLYNSRGQLAEIRVSTYSLTNAGHETDWNRGAIINHYSTAAGAWGATGGGLDNNGNLQKQEIYIPDNDQITGYTNVVQQYSYDSLNRLASVYDKPFNGTPDFVQGYVYERFGNRTIDQTLTTANVPRPQFTASTLTNQLAPPSGYTMSYDSAGNLIYDNYSGGGARTYDAENRMTTAQFVSGQLQTATYTYDADGHRTRRSAGAGGEVWQVYGMGGELLAEYAANASPSSPQKEYGYRGGTLLVTAEPAAVIRWLVTDQLGTPRMVIDKTGSLSGVRRHDYFPFGEEIASDANWRTTARGYVSDTVRQKFTGKERDGETGLDYFLARYYSPAQGRFDSPDEFSGGAIEIFSKATAANPTFYADLTDPQTLNKYTYCVNNPLRYVDPDGHKIKLPNQSEQDRREVRGRLLANLADNEKKYFRISYDKKTKTYSLGLKGNVDKALSQNHTDAFAKLVATIRDPGTVRVAISDTFTNNKGETFNTADFGGGATLNQQQSKSGDVESYLSRGRQTGDLTGDDGKAIPNPPSIVAGHEVLGHGLRLLTGPDNINSYYEYPARHDENVIRDGRGMPRRANPDDRPKDVQRDYPMPP